jgi:hypothetical protein
LQLNNNGGWEKKLIGTSPICDHGISSQGVARGNIFTKGNISDLLIKNTAGDIYCFSVPAKETDSWKTTLLIPGTGHEKGLAVGDINGDNLQDIVTAVRAEADKMYTIQWFKNSSSGKKAWPSTIVGELSHKPDRIAIGDMNNDGIPDIVVAEGRWPGLEADAGVYWFEQKNGSWQKHLIITQYSTNSLGLADMDGEGDLDIITAEHKGPQPKLQIFENKGPDGFTEHVISKGIENHIGAKLVDIDGDTDLDIIGYGWDQFQYMNIWLNESR